MPKGTNIIQLIFFLCFFGANAFADPIKSAISTKGNNENLIAIFNCNTGQLIADYQNEPNVSTVQYPRVAASGFCELHQYTNGTYYCTKGTCSGSCSLNNIPVSCSCN